GGNAQVPLSAVTKYERGIAPLVVNHQGQFPSVTITYNLAPNALIEDVTRSIEQAVAEMHIPDVVRADFSGDVQAYMQAGGGTTLVTAGGTGCGLHRPRCSLRKPRAPPDHHLDAAIGRAGSTAGPRDLRDRTFGHRVYRNYSADRHRQEERHHDGRFRPRR